MRVLWLTALVVLLDQASKQVVLRTMYLGQQIPILGDWLKFTFTENPGMAFGITFGPKAMVTIFAIIATVIITFYLYNVRHDYLPYRASLALILGGAVGNIIDRVFYGMLYDNDTLFVGKVVDFIHVNVWSGFIPETVPLIGGTYVSLFPIWNVADMAIVCGVVGIIAFQKVHHQQLQEREMAGGGAQDEEHGPAPDAPPDTAATVGEGTAATEPRQTRSDVPPAKAPNEASPREQQQRSDIPSGKAPSDESPSESPFEVPPSESPSEVPPRKDHSSS